MGIRYLNGYLNRTCSRRSIRKIHLKDLTGKTIVVDTSIYMYKFLAQGALVENMYLLITTLQHFKINPVFIFDGKTPVEKIDTVKQRIEDKKIAEEEYNKLQVKMKDDSLTEIEKVEIDNELKNLKRQFIKIKTYHFTNVRKLMDELHVKYIMAEEEADTLCAKLCVSGFAYGCMSDDTDMFVYGCPIVLRDLSLLNQHITEYDYRNILNDLPIDSGDFKDVLMLSQNDYNNDESRNLYHTLEWYGTYKREPDINVPFPEWLSKNTKYISSIERYERTKHGFHLDNKLNIDVHNMTKNVMNESEMDNNNTGLKNMLKNYNFIFIE